MDAAPITPFDWQRLLWGTDPAGFYLEIGFRSLVMYLALLALLRLLSKRTLTQLSVLEFGLVIVLGSAAGDPTFYQEIPLGHGLVVLLVVVAAQCFYTWLTRSFEAVETTLQGRTVELVREGCILLAELEKGKLSHEELFELLRMNEVRQLGEVEHAYLEQNGEVSVLRYDEPGPGLPLIPPWDLGRPERLTAGSSLNTPCELACMRCGQTREWAGILPRCPDCGHDGHTPARLAPPAISPRLGSKPSPS